MNKAAQLFLASEALTRSLTTSVVAVVVLCPGWCILRKKISDKKEQSCTLTKDSRILAKQGSLEMGR